jgi:hypothetical protein
VYSLFCPRGRNKEVEHSRNHPLERATQVIATDEQHVEAITSDGPLYGLLTTDEGVEIARAAAEEFDELAG